MSVVKLDSVLSLTAVVNSLMGVMFWPRHFRMRVNFKKRSKEEILIKSEK